MNKTKGRSGKLEYRERTKIKVTNQKERIKMQEGVRGEAKEGKRYYEWRAQIIQQLIPVGLEAVVKLLEEEVWRRVGKRHERGGEGNRWGVNPGWVYLGDQKVHMNVQRVRSKDGGAEIPLESYGYLQSPRQIDELGLRRVISGISEGKYEKALIGVPETFGIKKSSVSVRFIRASGKKLKEFMERDLSQYDIVSIVMDGKRFAQNQVVIAMGVTVEGEKILLGFVETSTEHHRPCKEFLQRLIDRGLSREHEILFVIDGAKGLKKGILEVFGKHAFIQRCQWHKRENVIKYLGKQDQEHYRRQLQAAYELSDYHKAKGRLLAIGRELEKINLSAASSLEEGLEETLTLHRLNLFGELGISFKTTNMLENINSMLELTTGRVSHWHHSEHRQRWIATALLEIEPRLKPVKGCRFLPALIDAMHKEIIQKQSEPMLKAA